MRNSLLMAHAFCSSQPASLATQAEAFKGDHDHFLDRLVVSSQKKQVDDALLQERALVPFFEPSDSLNTSFEPLERRTKKTVPFQPPHHGLKRNVGERSGANLSGSPPAPRKDAPAAKHRRAGKPAPGSAGGSASRSDSELSSATATFQCAVSFSSDEGRSGGASPVPRVQRKHTRQPSAQEMAAAAPGQGRRSPSPPHKREHRAAPAPAGTPTVNPSPGKFAGPAFCNSPTPDSLPIPTTSLLMMM